MGLGLAVLLGALAFGPLRASKHRRSDQGAARCGDTTQLQFLGSRTDRIMANIIKSDGIAPTLPADDYFTQEARALVLPGEAQVRTHR
jgi:hypothetical protein